MRNFKELHIWKQSIQLSVKIIEITKSFPAEEKFGLISQIRRSAVSIPSNIAEGCGRESNKEFVQFLHIALGSAYELETQILISIESNYIKKEHTENILNELVSIQKMILAFIMKVRTLPSKTKQ